MALSDDEQRRRRAWFRAHWETGVQFNRSCGITVRRWDNDAVELALPFADRLSAHDGIFHGGVIAALIDTAATGAVMAGHDFNLGSRVSTVSMAVQYLSAAPNEDVVILPVPLVGTLAADRPRRKAARERPERRAHPEAHARGIHRLARGSLVHTGRVDVPWAQPLHHLAIDAQHRPAQPG